MFYLFCVTQTFCTDKMRDSVMISAIVSIVCAGNLYSIFPFKFKSTVNVFIYIHTQCPAQIRTSHHAIIILTYTYTCLLKAFFVLWFFNSY